MPKTRRLKWLTTRNRKGEPGAYLIETSRYTPEDLRRIRFFNGVGRPPKLGINPWWGYAVYPSLFASKNPTFYGRPNLDEWQRKPRKALRDAIGAVIG